MTKKITPFFFTGLLLLLPMRTLAATDPLSDVYKIRPDLQIAFDPAAAHLAKSGKAGFLVDLVDWAHQYGWKEYKTLASYAPAIMPPTAGKTGAPKITARDYLVIDQSSGIILAAQGANEVWPVASLTKLMTAQVAIGKGIKMDAVTAMKTSDNVGGAQLSVKNGTTFKVNDLFYAMLIGSANNAANAIARTASSTFVTAMNQHATDLHLIHTKFVDASGIDPANVSTAREVALFANAAFALDPVHSIVTTATKDIQATSETNVRHLKSTNWMLYHHDFDDVYVTAGKTGFLDESGWNVVERLRPSANAKQKEVLIVLFGATSRQHSFDDADALAKWVWTTFHYASGAAG